MRSGESKQSAGYFREKAIIALSTLTGDDVDKAVQKATSHMLKAPKEKYVQQLIAFSYGRTGVTVHRGMPVNAYVLRELERRLRACNWVVVLKTLVVLHRLLMDASPEMVAQLCSHPRLFAVDAVRVVCDSTDAMTQMHFVAQYTSVLAERCMLQAFLRPEVRLDDTQLLECLLSLDAAAALPHCTALLRLLQVIGNVQYIDLSVNNFCTLEAYQLIVRDGKQVFQLLSRRVVLALEQFEQQALPQKRAWLALYRDYAAATDALRALFDTMRQSPRTFVEHIPQLQPLPESTLLRLEASVRLSSIPREVCTLASLGIARDAAAAHDGDVQSTATTTTTAQRTTSTTVATPPVRPAVSLDELFVAPAPPPTMTTIASASPPPPPPPRAHTIDDIFVADSVPCDSTAVGWSSGAPVEYASPDAPAGASVNDPCAAAPSPPTRSLPPWQALS